MTVEGIFLLLYSEAGEQIWKKPMQKALSFDHQLYRCQEVNQYCIPQAIRGPIIQLLFTLSTFEAVVTKYGTQHNLCYNLESGKINADVEIEMLIEITLREVGRTYEQSHLGRETAATDAACGFCCGF
jgi:hypothetical protein